jgi:hypothetical protein
MLRKLAILLLLPPMLLNGMWVICNPADAADSPAHSEESEHCKRICASLAATLGRICFLLPGESKSSITILDFGVAILPSEIVLQRIATDEQLAAEPPVSYWDPSLSNSTPPPRV